MRFVQASILVWTLVAPAWAATFGKVIPIGGHVADLALDSRRGVLYIANFAANRIDVMSTADHSLRPPIYVSPQPGTIALSPDQRFLVVGHYSEWTESSSQKPALTILDLDANQRRTLTLANSPLAVAFGNGSRALIVTTKDFQLLEPLTGTLRLLAEGAAMTTEKLPVPYPTFPPEITQASAGVSGDGEMIYVLAQGTGSAAFVQYRVADAALAVIGVKASPELGPRVVSVNRDGSLYVSGWALTTPEVINIAQFPYPTGKLNVGAHAFDWSREVIYAQVPNTPQPSASPAPTTPAPAPAPTTPVVQPPVLHVVDSDNLTVRERLQLRENLAGRSVFSPDMQVLYAASDSGVTVLPVGSLDRAPRVAASREDLMFRGNACDRRLIVREMEIVDLGGGNIDFSIAGARAGVRISPAAGVTPAKVQVEVDPTVFQNQRGTMAVPLEIRSSAAINLPPPVRLLINTREPEQRGAIANIPGKLVDVLADPVRGRVYVLRQDKNLVLVLDETSFEVMAALRTGNTPTQMAMTRDNRYLIVGNDNSQIANVYDLEFLQPSAPIVFPPGHYPRSFAVSAGAILASIRSAASPEHKIDRVNFEARTATELPTLGIYENSIHVNTVLTASPSGRTILVAMPDGNTMIYDAQADTFAAARKDLPAVTGALSALSDEMFLVDNNLLNASLVPITKLESGTGASSGFSVVDGLGLRTTSSAASSPGVIQRLDTVTLESIRPTRMIEAPVTPATLRTPDIGLIGQTIPQFMRTLAPLQNGNAIAALTVSGLSILPWDFDASVAPPVLSAVVNTADGSTSLAPGGLITVHGANLSSVFMRNSELPVPTTLGEACLTVNGGLIPMFLASPDRIEAQLSFDVVGAGRMLLRAPGGTSNILDLTIQPGAPAVLREDVAGQPNQIPKVFRATNNGRVTLSNPIHPEDIIVVLVTGLGVTSPRIEAGYPSPSEPRAQAVAWPEITLGDAPLDILYAGLVPGEIGIYEVHAKVPYWVRTGLEVPLVIKQGAQSTALPVRVVK